MARFTFHVLHIDYFIRCLKSDTKNRRFFSGFTIIELLIVFSVLAILSTVSVVSFVTYNKAQTLTSASRDIQQALSLAKSRAQSQVKPADCTKDDPPPPLIGYEMRVCINGQECQSKDDYEVDAICGAAGASFAVLSYSKNLPRDVTFDPGLTPKTHVLFGVLNNGVSDKISIRIKDISGGIKSITVDEQGNINEDI